MMESFFGTLKIELIDRRRWHTRDEIATALLSYLEGWYNPKRLQHALGWRPKSAEEVDAVLVGVVDRVTRRLRKAGRVGRTVVLRLRFDDFSRATRSHTLPEATSHTGVVLAAARRLLASGIEVDPAGATPEMTLTWKDNILRTDGKVCIVQVGSVTYSVVMHKDTEVDKKP